jgi:hypothetical protein
MGKTVVAVTSGVNSASSNITNVSKKGGVNNSVKAKVVKPPGKVVKPQGKVLSKRERDSLKRRAEADRNEREHETGRNYNRMLVFR